MFCPHCGNQVPDGTAFCPSCGAKQEVKNTQQQFTYDPNPGFNATPGFNSAPGGYMAPIKKREIVTAIILSIVTCGIYGIYWLYCMVNDLNTASQEMNGTSGGMVILLTYVTCGIYGYYWYYKAGEKVARIQELNGQASDKSLSILYLVLGIFGLGIVNYCLIQSELNKVAAQ